MWRLGGRREGMCHVCPTGSVRAMEREGAGEKIDVGGGGMKGL